MGGTQRSLTIATRLDTGGIETGARQGVATTRAMADQVKGINAQIERDFKSYAAPQDRFALASNERRLGQSLYGRGGAGPESKLQLQEKALLRERLEGMNAAGEAEYADRQQRAGQLRNEHRERLSYEDRYYNATHGFRDIETRRLNQEYQTKRLMHAGNNRMLLTLDKAYAAESAQLMAGDGPMGAKSGKKVLKFAAAHMVGEINPAMGQMAGYAAMGGMATGTAAGALAFGGIAAGALIGITAVKSYIERLDELKNKNIEMSRFGRQFHDAMTPKAETTAAGERARNAMDLERNTLEKLKDEAMEFETVKYKLEHKSLTGEWLPDARAAIALNESRQAQATASIDALSKQQATEDEKAIFRQVHQMSRAAERAGLGLLTPEVRARKEMELRHGDETEALARQKQEYKLATGKDLDPRFRAELERKQKNEKLVAEKAISDTQLNGLQKYKQAAKDLDNMVGEGKLDKKTADIQKAQIAGRMLGNTENGIGQSIDLGNRWTEIQSALLKPSDEPKLSGKDLAETRNILDDFRKRGIPIRPAPGG